LAQEPAGAGHLTQSTTQTRLWLSASDELTLDQTTGLYGLMMRNLLRTERFPLLRKDANSGRRNAAHLDVLAAAVARARA
jgi:hypothetical protein